MAGKFGALRAEKGNCKWFTANSNNQLLSMICSCTQLACSCDNALEHSHSGLNNSNTGVPGSTQLAFAWMSARRQSINFANAFNYLFMNMLTSPKCQNSVTHAFRNTTKSGVLWPFILPCLFREIVQSTSYPYAHFTCPKTGNLRNNIQWGIMLSFYSILVLTRIRRRLVLICLHSEFHLMWFHDGAQIQVRQCTSLFSHFSLNIWTLVARNIVKSICFRQVSCSVCTLQNSVVLQEI